MDDIKMKLFDILRESNIRRESLNLNPLWQEEIDSNVEIKILYEEFETLVLLPSELLASHFIGESAEGTVILLKERKKKWTRMLGDAIARYRESTFLTYLNESFISLGN